jgi:hypothetical protein
MTANARTWDGPMAITEILAVASGAGTSANRTIAAGVVERVGIKGATSNSVDTNSLAVVEVATNSAATIFEPHVALQGENGAVTALLNGPVTYRVTRRQGTIGAYVET